MKKSILKDNHCMIIAEVSANHGQNFERAVKMIRVAKQSGADAVKFQTYTPDTLTIDSDRKYFQIKHAKWGGQTLHQLYKKAYTPWSWFKKLKKVADDEGIMFFSAAFDRTAVDLLEELRVPVHKVASFELNDLGLIEYMAKTRKPIIMSTGMATREEIKDAVTTARRAGAGEVILLKCVSSYPALPGDMNLATIPDISKSFKCPAGLSDHSMGPNAAIAAVCLGARVVEKHFILSKKIKTPDSFFSVDADELKELVQSVRTVEDMIGSVFYGLTDEEQKNRVFRRSLFVVKDIKKGERLTEENVRSIRPGHGLSPKYLKTVLGKKAGKFIQRGTPLSRALITKNS